MNSSTGRAYRAKPPRRILPAKALAECYTAKHSRRGKHPSEVVFEKTVDFSDDRIKPEAGGPFLIDTQVEAPRFELEHKDGKIEGGTGKFIRNSAAAIALRAHASLRHE